jgi:hypothetical protein
MPDCDARAAAAAPAADAVSQEAPSGQKQAGQAKNGQQQQRQQDTQPAQDQQQPQEEGMPQPAQQQQGEQQRLDKVAGLYERVALALQQLTGSSSITAAVLRQAGVVITAPGVVAGRSPSPPPSPPAPAATEGVAAAVVLPAAAAGKTRAAAAAARAASGASASRANDGGGGAHASSRSDDSDDDEPPQRPLLAWPGRGLQPIRLYHFRLAARALLAVPGAGQVGGVVDSAVLVCLRGTPQAVLPSVCAPAATLCALLQMLGVDWQPPVPKTGTKAAAQKKRKSAAPQPPQQPLLPAKRHCCADGQEQSQQQQEAGGQQLAASCHSGLDKQQLLASLAGAMQQLHAASAAVSAALAARGCAAQLEPQPQLGGTRAPASEDAATAGGLLQLLSRFERRVQQYTDVATCSAVLQDSPVVLTLWRDLACVPVAVQGLLQDSQALLQRLRAPDGGGGAASSSASDGSGRSADGTDGEHRAASSQEGARD